MEEQNFLAPTEYYDSQDKQKLTGNICMLISAIRPTGTNREMYTVTGYITDRDTKEPVAGVTVFIQKLSDGNNSNEYGFYTLNLPRGVHLSAVLISSG